MKFKVPALCLLSVILLTLAFPKTNVWLFAWFALVPFLFALDGISYGKAFVRGWVTGFVFYGALLYWIGHVTVAGAVCLVAYLALYWGLFALGYVRFRDRPAIVRVVVLSCLWVVLEFIRGRFLSGFGWGNPGESQAANLFMIQIADFAGVHGVTFAIVLTNLWVKDQVQKVLADRKLTLQSFMRPVTWLTLGVLIFCFGYSVLRLAEAYREKSDGITVAIVQGNIEQRIKWSRPMWESILYRYTSLTKEMLGQSRVELIVWPETAYPGFMWETPEWFQELRNSTRRHTTPLLLGAVTRDGENYYNSALYLREDSYGVKPVVQYHKLHLVPFGEFIPLRNIFPFLEQIVPIDDFTAGEEYKLFPVLVRKDDISYHPPKNYFGVLICFEDTMAYLARGFTKRGANLLINITNDAWFMDSRAPFMHLQNSVFRAIVNRRSLIRAANTGVSGVIDPYGRITDVLEKDDKQTFVEGFKVANAALKEELTFYTRFGDVFVYFCLAVLAVLLLPANFFNKKLLL